MELGQYRSRSGRSVYTAKSSNWSRTVHGRSIFISCERKPDDSLTCRGDTPRGTSASCFGFLMLCCTPPGPSSSILAPPIQEFLGLPRSLFLLLFLPLNVFAILLLSLHGRITGVFSFVWISIDIVGLCSLHDLDM